MYYDEIEEATRRSIEAQHDSEFGGANPVNYEYMNWQNAKRHAAFQLKQILESIHFSGDLPEYSRLCVTRLQYILDHDEVGKEYGSLLRLAIGSLQNNLR
jgi:hypothetical protein